MARCLLIDNDDSFTHNLFQLLAQVNGELPVVLPSRAVSLSGVEALDPDQIVLSPGPGSPVNPQDFVGLAELVRSTTRPMLGVCLGHQGIAHALGGTITRAPVVMHGRLSRIRHDGSALFRGIPAEHDVVRYHSLVVSELPPELVATAWTEDGLVMALAHRARPLWGVQYHPEALLTSFGRELLTNFRDLAGERLRPPRVTPRPVPVKAETKVRAIDARTLPLGALDAERIFAGLFRDEPYAFWLDSSRAEPGLARFSFMGVPVDVLEPAPGGPDMLALLARELPPMRIDGPELPFAFAGGFVGYLGYEALRGGEAMFFRVERFIAIDHATATVYVVAGRGNDAWLDATATKLRSVPQLPPLPPPGRDLPAFHLARDEARYRDDIAACEAYILAGDSYELCLTNQVIVERPVDAWELHRTLRRLSPAPYAAFLKTPAQTVVSSSPEQFLRVQGGIVQSKPIKGTAPRGGNPEDDARLALQLAASEKTRSENMMIVDLLRNDLGVVCEPGSVEVPDLMVVETYATVHHLVSRIVGRLRPDIHVADAVRAAFPGGSMTGAPKHRTMQILEGLEGAPRGIYSGALGLLGFDGSVDLGMVIRTAVVTPERTTIGVGGAIVALSDPASEVAEMLLKAEPVLRAIAGVEVAPGSAAVARRAV